MSGATDIYGYSRNPKPTGVFSSDDSILSWGFDGSKGEHSPTGLMVQGWNLTYAQQIQEVFELGSHNIYWVKGRPQGNGNISRVIGPNNSSNDDHITLLPKEAFDPCAGGVAMTLSVGGKVCGVQNDNKSAELAYTMRIELDGLLVNNIGFSASVQDTRIMEALTFRFTYLDVKESKAN